jgi:ribulose kinase
MPSGVARVVAVDLGASSGRVFVVGFAKEHFEFAQLTVSGTEPSGHVDVPTGMFSASIVAFPTASMRQVARDTSTRSGSTPGVSTTACSTLMGGFSAILSTTATTAPAPSSSRS